MKNIECPFCGEESDELWEDETFTLQKCIQAFQLLQKPGRGGGFAEMGRDNQVEILRNDADNGFRGSLDNMNLSQSAELEHRQVMLQLFLVLVKEQNFQGLEIDGGMAMHLLAMPRQMFWL